MLGIYEVGEKDLSKYTALLYRHGDGYPDGVIPDIFPFVKGFVKSRGNDPEYLAARLMQHMTNQDDAGEVGVLGYGICNGLHGDIEYFYAVSSKGIRVFDCAAGIDFDKFKEIGSFSLDMSMEEVTKLLKKWSDND